MPKFMPSFSWGGPDNFTTYIPERAFESVEKMMSIHGHHLRTEDRLLLMNVFEETAKYRPWEQKEETGRKFFKIFEQKS